MTGFRVAYGGAQALYGVTPDLTCLGKIVGGGVPAAAYGGRAEVLSQVAPAGPVYQAGTLSGNPLAMAAGITQLELLGEPGVYERLEQLSAALAEGLAAAAAEARVPGFQTRVGSVFTTLLPAGAVTGLGSASAARYKGLRACFQSSLATR